MWNKLVYFIMCVKVALAQTDSLLVQLENGPLRGYLDAQGDFYSFQDVPYATAPTGVHKFKAPLPPPVWTEPFEAIRRSIACPQSLMPQFTIQEDCLVANIFVPVNATKVPVLVNVHGGAYIMGAGSNFELNSLVRTKKVIVVTFNYRLGVHGFLCLGTDDIPGNAGLKDQVALLRWINKNIAGFGGNPNDVSISGCSAGGGSLDFLTISPLTTGLFKKAITESGAVFGLAGTQNDPVENAKIYARKLNFAKIDDINALEEFYKTASIELLLSESQFVLQSTEDSSILFAPCVERETQEESFLTDTPMNILKNGNYSKIPLLYGFSEMEGLYRLPEFEIYKDRMNLKFSDFMPQELYFESESQKDEVAAKVKHFYFGDQNVTQETILTFVDYFTDVMFAYPMLRGANMRRASLGDTIYLYEYSFVDENTPLIPNTSVRGVDHCHQFIAVTDEDMTNASKEYKAMKDTMRELWLNFVTTGNPTPEGSSSLSPWPAINGFVSPFMSLNVTSRVEQSSLLGDRVRFWDSIYEEHYRPPVPPIDGASAPTISITLLTILGSMYIFF